MDPVYLGVLIALSLALGAALGIWLRIPARRYFESRRRSRELQQLFETTNRQQQLERLNQRRDLYLNFRNAAAALVEELADGGGRWASFYLVRDLLRDVNARATPDVALAARQLCFICQVMLNEGFSDSLSVKFNQNLQRYEESCREDLAAEAQRPSWPPEPDAGPAAADAGASANSTVARRQYFHVLR